MIRLLMIRWPHDGGCLTWLSMWHPPGTVWNTLTVGGVDDIVLDVPGGEVWLAHLSRLSITITHARHAHELGQSYTIHREDLPFLSVWNMCTGRTKHIRSKRIVYKVLRSSLHLSLEWDRVAVWHNLVVRDPNWCSRRDVLHSFGHMVEPWEAVTLGTLEWQLVAQEEVGWVKGHECIAIWL